MDHTAFNQLVAEALDTVPAEFARYLHNVSVVVEAEPSVEQLQALGLDPQRHTLFGLYQGVPLSARSHLFTGALPDKITIYQGPLERMFDTPAMLREQVRRTIVHEIAHFFGLKESKIRKLGY